MLEDAHAGQVKCRLSADVGDDVPWGLAASIFRRSSTPGGLQGSNNTISWTIVSVKTGIAAERISERSANIVIRREAKITVKEQPDIR